MTLDYYLQPFIRGKIDLWVRWLLRLSVYQMKYLTKIPEHAIVNEAVEIAKRRGHKGISSTVNGILRSILRQGVPSIDEIQDPIERLSIETSHPKWIVEQFVDSYGIEVATAMLHANNKPPKQTVRVNTLKGTVDETIQLLQQEGLEVEKGVAIPECLYISGGIVSRTKAYEQGLITIQDESSMVPVTVLNPQENWRVLDMCAAPGGKTTQMAAKMNNVGRIIATDIHEHKLKLINNLSKRLGINTIETVLVDGRKSTEHFEKESFDAILVDAPCSGIGVLRRKPDIKYTKTNEDFEKLHKIQVELLHNAATLLKKGGRLVYSTCTVNKIENENTVLEFLKQHPEMELAPIEHVHSTLLEKVQNNMLQIFPQDIHSDGFFIAAFTKKN